MRFDRILGEQLRTDLKLEMRKLLNVVQNLDPNAFIIANTIREASGGILSRKSHH